MSDSLRLMNWNITIGGFDSYQPDLKIPVREAEIQSFVQNAHINRGVEAAGLIDAYRWDEIYGSDEGIASHLGYQAARFVRLNDERLNRNNGAGVGIAFATDIPIEQSKALDLDNRQGLGVILDVGKYGLQVATVYLDDLSQGVREKQIRALFSNLEADVPTVVIGDFNMLRPDLRSASSADRTKDLAVRSLAHLIPRKDLRNALVEMNRRTGVTLVESFGFTDADNIRKRPTAPSILPVLGIDYVFYNNAVHVNNIEVVPAKKTSDHSAIITDLCVSE
jgi:endonuclease/exonuclease/phosphatase family metal-dependent hydrolase